MAVIAYVPAAMLATTNEAVRVPPEMEHVTDPTGLPESEQLESLDEKPEPDTEIVVPVRADAGLIVICGERAVNWKAAVA